MIKILLILSIAFVINSCETEEKFTLAPPEYYDDFPEYYDDFTSYTIRENTKLLSSEFVIKLLLLDSSNLIKINHNRHNNFAPNLTLQAIEYYRDNERDFLFYKNLLYTSTSYHGVLYQIEYPIELNGRKKMIIMALKQYYNKYSMQAAFVEWSSKPMNPINIDNPPELDYAGPKYLWGINKLTDTITTNLNQKSIKKLYPDFKGVYIYKKYKEIIFDYSYSTFDRSFFEHIVFIE